MKQWYSKLFENYANQYEKEVFTQGTLGEVDFIENEINHNMSVRILDVGCGTGRHAIELAKRGYQVTGLDLSANMLAKARANAKAAGVRLRFIQKDARQFRFRKKFDLAIMLCEGSFPLMETDEMNFRILKNCYNSLLPGGKLIFTTLNGLFPLFHSVKDFINEAGSTSQSIINNFDLMTFRDHSVVEVTDDSGEKLSLACNERYYVPSEISWLLKSIGFINCSIHGCRLGAFSRTDNLRTDDYEMLVIANK
jgi:2-polyprenyl-3-methyl-5-hydroxy-6-metoxy-1,4-benzoquinol methylase